MRILYFLTLMCSFVGTIFVMEPAYALDNKQKLTLVSALSPPYVYYGDDGELKGIIVDMVEMLNQASDYRVVLYHVPPQRIYMELETGYADLSILPAGPNAESVAYPIIEVSRSSIVFASLLHNKDKIKKLADISKKRVGYVKGINYGVLFDGIDNVGEVPLLSTDIGVEMVLKDRIDFILSSERTLAYHLQTKRFSDKIALAYRVSEKAAYLYVSKKSEYIQEIKSHLAEVIGQLKASKEWQQAYQHLTLQG